MNFPVYDLNISLHPRFIAAIDAALQSNQAELVLVHALTGNHGLYVAKNYLRIRARAMVEASQRRVHILGAADSEEQLEDVIKGCMPGDLVFLPELRPSGPYNAVGTAAQFVSKGATVFATIHGLDAKYARTRLEQLWADECSKESRPAHAVFPACRFIPYAARVEEVPVVQA